MPTIPTRSRLRTGSLVRLAPLWSAAIALVVMLGFARSRASADERAGTASPVAVVSARSFEELAAGAEDVLTVAGATRPASRLEDLLRFVGGFQGFDRDRPLGVLVFLPPEFKTDQELEPDFIGFLPIDSMQELQRSLAAFQRITLTPRGDAGMWELNAGMTRIPVRLEGGYAFVALREELLADPLPDVAELTSTHAGYDIAASLLRDGVSDKLRERAIADVLRNLRRDAERDRPSDPDERAMHDRVVMALEWLLERSLRDVEHARVGLRFLPDDRRIDYDVTAAVEAETPLFEAMSQMPAGDSLFRQLPDREAPLAVSAAGRLSGETHEFVIDTVALLRRDVERRMDEDGTANGPAAAPIRQMLDALTATVAAGQIDGCLVFDGDQPGAMSMLAAVRLEQAGLTAKAIEDFLLLVAETPAVADLELNVVEAEGVKLHRLTLQELRKQDEWLYGPDVGLYVGAGRDALWLALGGFEREEQIKALLERSRVVADSEAPSLVKLNIRMKPWVNLDDERSDNSPRWLKLAQAAFADGGDWLRIDLAVVGNELRLQGTIEEGYIRFAGAASRARGRRSKPGKSPNLAAPVIPQP